MTQRRGTHVVDEGPWVRKSGSGWFRVCWATHRRTSGVTSRTWIPKLADSLQTDLCQACNMQNGLSAKKRSRE